MNPTWLSTKNKDTIKKIKKNVKWIKIKHNTKTNIIIKWDYIETKSKMNFNKNGSIFELKLIFKFKNNDHSLINVRIKKKSKRF